MFQKIINIIIYLVIFSLPLYLVRFRIGWVPTNFLEILIVGLFVGWLFFIMIVRGRASKLLLFAKGSNFEARSLNYPVFLILFGITISTLFSSNLETSAGIWKGWFLIPLLFFVVVINQIKTKEQIRNALIALLSSGVIVSLIAFFYWLNGNLTYDDRLRAFYLSANHLAMFLSPVLILSLYLYSVFKKRVYKIILFFIHCFLFFIVYLTYSYGAFLGIFCALLYILIRKKDKKIILIFFLLVVFGLILQIPSQKFQGFLDFSYPSLKSRLVIWQSAWEIIKDRPLIGVGPGMFQEYYLDYQIKSGPYPEWAVPQPHNLFLAFWLQTGLFGLIGFVWLLIYFFKKTDPRRILGSVLIAVMLCILIHGLVDTTYWKNDLSVIFWLIVALSCTLRLKVEP